MTRPGTAALIVVALTSAASAQSSQPGAPALRSTTTPAASTPDPAVQSANPPAIDVLPKLRRPTRRPHGAPVVAGNNNVFVDEAGELTTNFRP